MRKLLWLLGFVSCFSLATVMDSTFYELRSRSNDATSVAAAMLGDSRAVFAGLLFRQADVTFHSGFYPTVFDKQETDIDVKGEGEGATTETNAKPEIEETFLGPPLDWMERFGRNFYPTNHTHLDDARAREVLPWLKLSADLDPHNIDAYLTASYWLRRTLDQPNEAEDFLRQGLRANPDSFEIMLELAYVDDYSRHNAKDARVKYELALAAWEKQDAAWKSAHPGATDENQVASDLGPNPKTKGEILDGIARADKVLGDWRRLLADLEALKKVSHDPDAIEKRIEEAKAKLAESPAPTSDH